MSEEQLNTASPVEDENQIMAIRRQKLADIRNEGIAYPNDFRRDAMAKDLHDKYGSLTREEIEAMDDTVKVSGRMMLKREMGKANFATLQDVTGQIQLYISNKSLDAQTLESFKHWDLGDIIAAEGLVFKTHKEELSIRVTHLRLLSKSLRPLPDKHHGLADQEQRYRQRYADLIINEKSRDIFIKRSKIVQTVRDYMVDESYLEVETPMMHPIPGGATAKPFVTHHNALDMPLYLRIAPELYLKRLIIGGLERVFEINRSFRNEGVSTRHNPEFTMIEFYEAYSDYDRMMQMAEGIIRACAQTACGTTSIIYNDKEVDLGKPFAKMTILEAILKYNPQYNENDLNNIDWLKSEIKKLGGKYPTSTAIGALQLELFEECAEERLWEPTFIVDYPVEVSPLARASDSKEGLTERFELFVVGRELANGYSELNDPEDQSARFKAQVAQKDAGDDEAMHYDADYIRAMEYGMPPTGGCGIGIDRLVMLLTNAQTIRDVILFPQMRPE